MRPFLSRRGKLILASSILFVLVGALHGSGPLIGLGGLSVCSLMAYYLYFFPTAILLRRRKVELSWWVPPGDQPGGALAVERPFNLHIALRNHGQRRLRILEVELFGSKALELPQHIEAMVPPGRQVEVVAITRARACGYLVFHGAVLHFGDALGLFDLSAYFPNPIAIKVFPKQAAIGRGSQISASIGGMHERVGVHQVRNRGLVGDLREIREHAHGDPFKYIAWKATAKRGRLMVRELETEIVVTHQLLVDISGTTRRGTPGRSTLDFAIETAAALARAAVEGGDRVGLTTFDTRIYSELKVGEGHHHYLQLLDRLIELHNVVDDDLTDVTEGELVAAAAKYLAHQEAVDVRVGRIPRLDDPAWETIQAGPQGELYDLNAAGGVVKALLRSIGSSKSKHVAPTRWATKVVVREGSDPKLADLRRFCRVRGIELPITEAHARGERAKGMAAALAKVASGRRADVVVLISDFVGYLEAPSEVRSAIARARRGGRQVAALIPFGPDFYPRPQTEAGALVAAALARAEEERFQQIRRRLAKAGVPLVKISPRDNVSSLASKMSRGSRRAA